VLTGEIDREVGKELKLALELRAKARYRPEAKLSRRDAKFVIDLAEKLSDIARKKAVKISTYGKHRLVGGLRSKAIKGAWPREMPRKSGFDLTPPYPSRVSL
jgi:hypothetical protein